MNSEQNFILGLHIIVFQCVCCLQVFTSLNYWKHHHSYFCPKAITCRACKMTFPCKYKLAFRSHLAKHKTQPLYRLVILTQEEFFILKNELRIDSNILPMKKVHPFKTENLMNLRQSQNRSWKDLIYSFLSQNTKAFAVSGMTDYDLRLHPCTGQKNFLLGVSKSISKTLKFKRINSGVTNLSEQMHQVIATAKTVFDVIETLCVPFLLKSTSLDISTIKTTQNNQELTINIVINENQIQQPELFTSENYSLERKVCPLEQKEPTQHMHLHSEKFIANCEKKRGRDTDGCNLCEHTQDNLLKDKNKIAEANHLKTMLLSDILFPMTLSSSENEDSKRKCLLSLLETENKKYATNISENPLLIPYRDKAVIENTTPAIENDSLIQVPIFSLPFEKIDPTFISNQGSDEKDNHDGCNSLRNEQIEVVHMDSAVEDCSTLQNKDLKDVDLFRGRESELVNLKTVLEFDHSVTPEWQKDWKVLCKCKTNPYRLGINASKHMKNGNLVDCHQTEISATDAFEWQKTDDVLKVDTIENENAHLQFITRNCKKNTLQNEKVTKEYKQKYAEDMKTLQQTPAEMHSVESPSSNLEPMLAQKLDMEWKLIPIEFEETKEGKFTHTKECESRKKQIEFETNYYKACLDYWSEIYCQSLHNNACLLPNCRVKSDVQKSRMLIESHLEESKDVYRKQSESSSTTCELSVSNDLMRRIQANEKVKQERGSEFMDSRNSSIEFIPECCNCESESDSCSSSSTYCSSNCSSSICCSENSRGDLTKLNMPAKMRTEDPCLLNVCSVNAHKSPSKMSASFNQEISQTSSNDNSTFGYERNTRSCDAAKNCKTHWQTKDCTKRSNLVSPTEQKTSTLWSSNSLPGDYTERIGQCQSSSLRTRDSDEETSLVRLPKSYRFTNNSLLDSHKSQIYSRSHKRQRRESLSPQRKEYSTLRADRRRHFNGRKEENTDHSPRSHYRSWSPHRPSKTQSSYHRSFNRSPSPWRYCGSEPRPQFRKKRRHNSDDIIIHSSKRFRESTSHKRPEESFYLHDQNTASMNKFSKKMVNDYRCEENIDNHATNNIQIDGLKDKVSHSCNTLELETSYLRGNAKGDVSLKEGRNKKENTNKKKKGTLFDHAVLERIKKYIMGQTQKNVRKRNIAKETMKTDFGNLHEDRCFNNKQVHSNNDNAELSKKKSITREMSKEDKSEGSAKEIPTTEKACIRHYHITSSSSVEHASKEVKFPICKFESYKSDKQELKEAPLNLCQSASIKEQSLKAEVTNGKPKCVDNDNLSSTSHPESCNMSSHTLTEDLETGISFKAAQSKISSEDSEIIELNGLKLTKTISNSLKQTKGECQSTITNNVNKNVHSEHQDSSPGSNKQINMNENCSSKAKLINNYKLDVIKAIKSIKTETDEYSVNLDNTKKYTNPGYFPNHNGDSQIPSLSSHSITPKEILESEVNAVLMKNTSLEYDRISKICCPQILGESEKMNRKDPSDTFQKCPLSNCLDQIDDHSSSGQDQCNIAYSKESQNAIEEESQRINSEILMCSNSTQEETFGSITDFSKGAYKVQGDKDSIDMFVHANSTPEVTKYTDIPRNQTDYVGKSHFRDSNSILSTVTITEGKKKGTDSFDIPSAVSNPDYRNRSGMSAEIISTAVEGQGIVSTISKGYSNSTQKEDHISVSDRFENKKQTICVPEISDSITRLQEKRQTLNTETTNQLGDNMQDGKYTKSKTIAKESDKHFEKMHNFPNNSKYVCNSYKECKKNNNSFKHCSDMLRPKEDYDDTKKESSHHHTKDLKCRKDVKHYSEIFKASSVSNNHSKHSKHTNLKSQKPSTKLPKYLKIVDKIDEKDCTQVPKGASSKHNKTQRKDNKSSYHLHKIPTNPSPSAQNKHDKTCSKHEKALGEIESRSNSKTDITNRQRKTSHEDKMDSNSSLPFNRKSKQSQIDFSDSLKLGTRKRKDVVNECSKEGQQHHCLSKISTAEPTKQKGKGLSKSISSTKGNQVANKIYKNLTPKEDDKNQKSSKKLNNKQNNGQSFKNSSKHSIERPEKHHDTSGRPLKLNFTNRNDYILSKPAEYATVANNKERICYKRPRHKICSHKRNQNCISESVELTNLKRIKYAESPLECVTSIPVHLSDEPTKNTREENVEQSNPHVQRSNEKALISQKRSDGTLWTDYPFLDTQENSKKSDKDRDTDCDSVHSMTLFDLEEKETEESMIYRYDITCGTTHTGKDDLPQTKERHSYPINTPRCKKGKGIPSELCSHKSSLKMSTSSENTVITISSMSYDHVDKNANPDSSSGKNCIRTPNEIEKQLFTSSNTEDVNLELPCVKTETEQILPDEFANHSIPDFGDFSVPTNTSPEEEGKSHYSHSIKPECSLSVHSASLVNKSEDDIVSTSSPLTFKAKETKPMKRVDTVKLNYITNICLKCNAKLIPNEYTTLKLSTGTLTMKCLNCLVYTFMIGALPTNIAATESKASADDSLDNGKKSLKKAKSSHQKQRKRARKEAHTGRRSAMLDPDSSSNQGQTLPKTTKSDDETSGQTNEKRKKKKRRAYKQATRNIEWILKEEL